MKRLRTHTSHLTYVSLASLIIVVRRSIRGLKHDPDDEPAATTLDPDYFNFEGMQCKLRPFALFSSSHHYASEENDSLDKVQLKELLYDEVVSFVPSI